MKKLNARPKAEKITCSICGETLQSAEEFEKMQHVYQKHTAEFGKKIVQAVPNIRRLGAMLGTFLRENLKP